MTDGGTKDQARGRLEEAAGAPTDDLDLESEGKVEAVRGESPLASSRLTRARSVCFSTRDVARPGLPARACLDVRSRPQAGEALRNETRAHHRALERALSPLFRPDLHLPAYAAYLRAWRTWLAAAEKPVWHVGGWPDGMDPEIRAAKAGWITEDLVALRSLPRGSENDLLGSESLLGSERVELPNLSTLDRRFGAAYVIEGSTLGGRVLLERWHPELPQGATRWLRGYGGNTRRLWTTFQDGLDGHVSRHGSLPTVVHAARDTFDSLHRWFFRRGIVDAPPDEVAA